MKQLGYILLSLMCLSIFQTEARTHLINFLLDDATVNIEGFLQKFDVVASQLFNNLTRKWWELDTNITAHNEEQFIEQQIETAKFLQDVREKAIKFNDSSMTPDNRRQLKKIIAFSVPAQQNLSRFEELAQMITEMETLYLTANICLSSDECLFLDNNISRVMATSRDYDQLLFFWVGWRNATGRKIRQKYSKYVELINESARLSGYNDSGELWRSLYETDKLQDDVHTLYDQIHPLYEQLHAYVRRRLKNLYGEHRFPSTGHIPAHILGNMWAQDWSSLYDILTPFKNKTSMDVTAEMIKQNYTAEKIYQTAEDFFVSLGLDRLNSNFWNRSILERPNDGRKMSCVRSAWDFADKQDFRVKMCTEIRQKDLINAHHEVAHIQYFMAYKNLPFIYREGANDAFHEAIADLISVSVETFEHMKMLGLVNETSRDNETDLNFLMKVALLKVAFLPFGYMIDKFRWSVFNGQTTPDKYTKVDWTLRCDYQGISPPVRRTEEDFDAGAKYHIAANIPYLRYFLSFIMQFQFHEAVCRAAGHKGPLYKCDIANNKAVGDKLREVLKLGSSKPSPEVLKLLTGSDTVDARPLMEYFQPLMEFLIKENGNDYGWQPECPVGSL